ncbi:MAG: 2Fe-2S iron-sulfur cluster binding domain-containing protein [Gammaproteobacteria bacterium]|nr:2Fe-2S iron-sulfur cluster binding domain-containing protein [Gammaproteobacteria bacterium]NNM20767.1 2Fe-2S iron-sulfur cluster binding domain-containing protein [Gammaproteobacteria bacterium]
MLQFHPATIVEKHNETDDSVLLTLEVAAEFADEYRYSQGQHLPVRATIDGNELRRTYSICSSVSDANLRLGIRIQGKVSGYLAEQLEVGDTLEVMPPTGHFQTPVDPQQQKTYAAFVAGSGITPILSIAKTALETEPDSRFFIFYGNRKRSSTMFIEELCALKNNYPERLALHFIMSQEENEIPLYSGRVDGVRVKLLHQAFLAETRPDDIFVCGPNPMIDDVTDSLIELGYDAERIHSERFRPNQPDSVPAQPDRAPPPDGVRVTVVMDGNRQTFAMEDAEQTLLDAALDLDIDLPYSCMGGVCSTCRTKLVKGKVNMEVNSALEDWELEEGYVLTCQSRPESDEIELDYDQA